MATLIECSRMWTNHIQYRLEILIASGLTAKVANARPDPPLPFETYYTHFPPSSPPLLSPSLSPTPLLLPLFSSSLASCFEVVRASQPCYMGRHTALQTRGLCPSPGVQAAMSTSPVMTTEACSVSEKEGAAFLL